MQNFLITGGAGFIGSHLADALLASGHQVTAVDDLSTGRVSNIGHLMNDPRFKFVRASIFDEMILDRLVKQANVVVHLAAAVGVQLIVRKPVHTIKTNVMGSECVLRIALRYGCKVLMASSSEVYGKANRIPFSEEDDVLLGASSRPRWAYAASKLVDEFLGLAYHAEFGLDVVIGRLFNTVGPRQSGEYGMVVPRFVQAALRGDPLTVYGDGTQTRCFSDASDVVQAIALLAAHPEAPGHVFNIGGTEEVAIADLAQKVKAMTRSPSVIRRIPYADAYAPGFEDMRRRVPDTARLRQLTGWEPRRSLDDLLGGVIEYERRGLTGETPTLAAIRG